MGYYEEKMMPYTKGKLMDNYYLDRGKDVLKILISNG